MEGAADDDETTLANGSISSFSSLSPVVVVEIITQINDPRAGVGCFGIFGCCGSTRFIHVPRWANCYILLLLLLEVGGTLTLPNVSAAPSLLLSIFINRNGSKRNGGFFHSD